MYWSSDGVVTLCNHAFDTAETASGNCLRVSCTDLFRRFCGSADWVMWLHVGEQNTENGKTAQLKQSNSQTVRCHSHTEAQSACIPSRTLSTTGWSLRTFLTVKARPKWESSLWIISRLPSRCCFICRIHPALVLENVSTVIHHKHAMNHGID